MPYNYLGTKKNIANTIYNIMLFSMLHSSFIAPIQEMLLVHYNHQPSLKYKASKPPKTEAISTSCNAPSESNCISFKENSSESPTRNVKTTLSYTPEIVKESIIGVSKEFPLDDPSDNLFKINIDSLPTENDKVFLSYELFGISDNSGVSRSINNRLSTGGYMVKEQKGWSKQTEELDVSWLKEGENKIMFTTPKGADHTYKIKNLKVAIERDQKTISKLILQKNSIALKKDNTIYIKGFVKSAPNQTLKVMADGTELNMLSNEFEGFVELTKSNQNKGFISVIAYDEKGLIGQEIIDLGILREADKSYKIEKEFASHKFDIKAFSSSKYEVSGASIQITDSSMTVDKTISITPLRKIDIAPMESGMINVTKGGKAFRFLPDGTKFNKPVKISLEYDTILLPSGYGPKDIKTFYFDTDSKQWRAVKIDTIDIKKRTVTALTTHFTDYINGIVQLPESPQTSAFMPNMMNDIKAADPSSEMTFISPPQASQKGDANISFPIKIPAGRKGMQPQLAIQYSNDGGNGWLGKGWDLNVPAITLDTRWGVPIFDKTKETELYALNGQQLMFPENYLPNRHQNIGSVLITEQQDRNLSGIKNFTPRKQGSFTKIERLGNSPSTYYWKVTNTDGTVSWYGGKDNLEPNAILQTAGGIAHWALYMVEDVYGNNIKYTYDNRLLENLSGPNANLNHGSIFTIKNIYYTGKDGENGNYQIEFIKETSISRPDLNINARLGLKQIEPYRLASVNVKYLGEKIRTYKFDYSIGKLKKSQLRKVSEFDKNDQFFYSHDFDYYDDVSQEGGEVYFSAGVEVDVCNDDYVPCTDTDEDGVCDENDDCPNIPGLQENGGCPENSNSCYEVTFPAPLTNIIYYYSINEPIYDHTDYNVCNFTPVRIKDFRIGNTIFPAPNNLYLTHYTPNGITNLCPSTTLYSTAIQNVNFDSDASQWINSLFSSLNLNVDNLQTYNSSFLDAMYYSPGDYPNRLSRYSAHKFSLMVYSPISNLEFAYSLEYINSSGVPITINPQYNAGSVIESGSGLPGNISINNQPLSATAYNLYDNLNVFINDFQQQYGVGAEITLSGFDINIKVSNPTVPLNSIQVGGNSYNFAVCKGFEVAGLPGNTTKTISRNKQNKYANYFRNLLNNNSFEFSADIPFGDPNCPSFLNLDFLITGSIPSFNSAAGVLGSTKSKSYSAGGYIGFGIGWSNLTKITTFGVGYSHGWDSSESFSSLIDINGDGLEDIVTKEGGNIYYKAHRINRTFDQNNEEQVTHSFDSKRLITGINEFFRQEGQSSSFNFSISAGFAGVGAFAGKDQSNSKSETDIYFTDANGDGLPDVVRGGKVYFNRLDANGNPNFIADSQGTPNLVITASPKEIEIPAEYFEDDIEFPKHDVVKVWEAPADGAIKIFNDISLEDSSKEAMVTVEMNKKSDIPQCPGGIASSGGSGSFTYIVDFGTEIGFPGINYNSYSVPDKFDIAWNGQLVTSGYVGDSEYDLELLNSGIPASELQTGSPTTGAGTLNFHKTSAYPTTAEITVTAPLSGTAWNLYTYCANEIPANKVQHTPTLHTENKNCFTVSFPLFKNNSVTSIYINDIRLSKENKYAFNQTKKSSSFLTENIKDLNDFITDIEKTYFGSKVIVSEDNITIKINNSYQNFETIKFVIEKEEDRIYDFKNTDCITGISNNLRANSPAVTNYHLSENSTPSEMCQLYGAVLNISSPTVSNTITHNANCNLAGGPLTVKKGDRIYFRVHSITSGNPQVNWNPRIEYTETTLSNTIDQNNQTPFKTSYSDGFILSQENEVVFPGNGTAAISWPQFSVNPTDEVVFEITKKVLTGIEGDDQQSFYDLIPEIPVYRKVCPPNVATTMSAASNAISGVDVGNIAVSGTTTGSSNPTVTVFYFRVKSSSNVNWKQFEWKPKMINSTSEQVIGDSGTSEGTLASSQTKYPIPSYSIYKSYVKSKLYNQYNLALLDSDTANLSILPSLSGIFSQGDTGKLFFVVKKNGVFSGRKLITINNGAVSLDTASPIVLGTASASKVEIGYYIDDSKLADAEISLLEKMATTSNKLAVITGAQSHDIYLENVNLFQKPNPKFGPMHRQWGQFLYNPSVVQGAVPLTGLSIPGFLIKEEALAITRQQADAIQDAVNDINGLNLGGASLGSSTDNTNSEAFEDTLANFETEHAALYNAPFFSAQPSRDYTDSGYKERWIGMHQESYASALSYRAAMLNQSFEGYNDPDDEIEQDVLQTGAYSISRYSKGSGKNISGGGNVEVTPGVTVGISGSKSPDGRTNSLTDYVDMNGDRYPDLVSKDQIQLTMRTGGLYPSAGRNNNFSGDLGKFESNGWGVTASGTYSAEARRNAASSGSEKSNTSLKGFTLKGASLSKPTFELFGGGASAGISGEFSKGKDKTVRIWTDMNGDGLSDLVEQNGSNVTIKLNFGSNNFDSNSQHSQWASFPISTGSSSAFGGGIGFNWKVASIQAGISLGKTVSNTNQNLIDINGDGLLDLVNSDSDNGLQIRLNQGNTFGPLTGWSDFKLQKSATNIKSSLNASATAAWVWSLIIPFCCVIPLKIPAITPNASTSTSTSKTLKSISDFDGDGYPDLLEEISSNKVRVHSSRIRRTDMLKSVTNSLGGKFTIDYKVEKTTYANPHAKWVMTEVAIEDGYDHINDGIDIYKKRYKYENARYDRREREFYGFETVIAEDYTIDDELQPLENYRTSVTKYYNNSYFLNGLMKESYVMKGNNTNQLYSKTLNTYEIRPLDTEGYIDTESSVLPLTFDVGGSEGRRTAAVLLASAKNFVYELEETPLVRENKLTYDKYGRVIEYLDLGNLDIAEDDYSTSITYHELFDRHILNVPKEVQVFNSLHELMRSRFTDNIDQATGTIGSITAMINNSDAATTTMEYDEYGNLKKITYPENENGQSFFHNYYYEDSGNNFKYVTKIEDAFGYSSSSSYLPEFDAVQSTTDLAGNKMNYTYDTFGRLKTILAPKETQGAQEFTIAFEYYPKLSDLRPKTCINEKDFAPFAITRHFDINHPDNTIDTHTFIDGLARPIQIKKDIYINTGAGAHQEAMSVSGKIKYDEFGRATKQYHPYYEKKDCAENQKVNEYDSPYFTEIFLDAMDRSIKSLDPEGNVSEMQYGLEQDGFGNMALLTKSIVDQNSQQQIITSSYKDVMGRVTSTLNIGPDEIWTKFEYNAIGELLSYVDAEGIATSYEYDLMGRKSSVNHPDNGMTTFVYDKASNLINLKTANLAASSSAPIVYKYDFNRISEIIYPDTPSGDNISNVMYGYGSSGNETGRLVYQNDATGVQEFKYGNMGEVIENKRMIIAPNLPQRVFTTYFNYDSWNRIQTMTYPDGEKVTYTYDYGGNLNKIQGKFRNEYYDYIKRIDYDYFEQRTYVSYGNNTENHYKYTPTLRRLNNLQTLSSNQENLFSNNYSFDKVGNVTALQNNAGANSINNMGGIYNHSYTYDNLNRLSEAEGNFKGELQDTSMGTDKSTYKTSLSYNATHGIAQKDQEHTREGIAYQPNTYKNTYNYHDGTHKLKSLYDNSTSLEELFYYDSNGNTVHRIKSNGEEQKYFWDESNRLRATLDQNGMQHYIYDAAGERVLKASSNIETVYENGTPVNPSGITFNAYKTYPSAFIVVDGNGQYSKHYYAGSERIVSCIGDQSSDIFNVQTELGAKPGFDPIALQQLQLNDLKTLADSAKMGKVTFKEPKPEKANEASRAPEPGNIYFFHPDHLGTATYLTDINGNPYQFFLNLPFGETMAEQHSLSENYENPFKFNGKELDEETGLYYYGARYYDPRTSIWLSVDPLAEKYPNVNPYVYCVENPVNVIDPDGRDIIHLNKAGSIIKIVKDGSSRITIMDGGKAHKLSDYRISKGGLLRDRQVVANVAGYYGKKVGITGVGATSKESGMAHYNPDKKMIYIAAQENGKANPLFNNLNNLTSALVHENKHKQDHINGVETTYTSHASVYLHQMKDKTFASTTEDFAEGQMGSFMEFLKAAKHYGEDGVDGIINDFNNSNIKGGYKIIDRNSGGLQLFTPNGDEKLLPLAPIKTDPN